MKLGRQLNTSASWLLVIGILLLLAHTTKAIEMSGELPPLGKASVTVQKGNTLDSVIVLIEGVDNATDIKIFLQNESFAAPLYLGQASQVSADQSRWYFLWDSSNITSGVYSVSATVSTSAGAYEASPATISIDHGTSTTTQSTQDSLTPESNQSASSTAQDSLPTTSTSQVPETTITQPTVLLHLSQDGIIKGLLEINVQVDGAESVELYITPRDSTVPRFIGKALKIPSSNFEWKYVWDSKTVPNGLYELSAKIKNQAGSYGSSFAELAIVNESETSAPKIIPTPTPIQPPVKTSPPPEKQNLEAIKESVKTDILATTDTLMAISQRTAENELTDSDNDGISDYDEAHIYYTDPANPDSDKDSVFDGDELLQSMNPRDPVPSAVIAYEDPKSSGTQRNDLFSVVAVSVVHTILKPDGTKTADKIAINGKAAPGSFVTLYIFSTPIIVTVKVNARGEWSYVLDKELEDGTHLIYVAMTNGNGKIIAKSNPIPFIKQAEAATLDKNSFDLGSQGAKPSFFGNQPILTGLILLLAVTGLALIIVGLRRTP